MFSNYIILAIRTIRRQKAYAAINILGLAVGLACCIFILFYVNDELNFDAFHKSSDHIVRIGETESRPGREVQYVGFTAGAVGPLLVEELPEVISSVRLAGRQVMGRRTLERGETRFYEEEFFFTDPTFSEVFDFEWEQGDPETALKEPFSVVLTERAAEQYFGSQNPMGETLTMEQWGELTVTGVMANPPRNSHLDFKFLISLSTIDSNVRWKAWYESWRSSGLSTYLLLREDVVLADLEEKVDQVITQFQSPEFAEWRQVSLQPLRDIHFGSAHIDVEENWREGNTAYLYIFSIISLFILLIACFNYINLATAQAMKRAREVGVRKALGARREQLFSQFLGESTVLTLVSMGLALVLVYVGLPFFNTIAGKDIVFSVLSRWEIILALGGLLIFVGIAAGSYPAFFLGKFVPVRVLKGEATKSVSALRVRQGLVVTQFTLSICLLIATFVIGNQLEYVQNRNLGFNKEAILAVDINSGDARSSFETMKREFASHASVNSVSVSSQVPGDWKTIPQVDVNNNAESADALQRMYFIGADEDFLSTYEIELASGQNFSGSFGLDSTSAIINETAAQALGIQSAGDHFIEIPQADDEPTYRVQVIGIVKDFHFQSLHEEIAPLIVGYRSNPIDVIDYYSIRVQMSGIEETLAHLRGVGEAFDPTHPFEYNFLDERLNDFYVTEHRVSRLFNLAASFSIFIACLGLLGLASFMAGQRTKEIGVRKALGASVFDMVVLLSKDFVRLVCVALLVASPLAYFAMTRWLEDFAYAVSVDLWLFPLAGFLTVLVALLTVSYQSIKAATANPIDALHYE